MVTSLPQQPTSQPTGNRKIVVDCGRSVVDKRDKGFVCDSEWETGGDGGDTDRCGTVVVVIVDVKGKLISRNTTATVLVFVVVICC